MVQPTQLYNSAYAALMDNEESPTDSTSAEFRWLLVSNSYVPLLTHDTGTDLGGYEYTASPAAPIAATQPVLESSGSDTYFKAGTSTGSGVVQFGPGEMNFRYLVFARTRGAYVAGTADLIFYIDLVGGDTNLSTSSIESVTVNMPATGWFKMYQA